MQIRPFKPDDQNKVIELWNNCGLLVSWNDPVKDIKRKLERDPDLFIVGIIKEQIIATVMGGYEGHRGWINYLAVSPEFQGLGYGRKIMEYIEARIKEMGCPKINLQVRKTNREVVDFYKSLGYGDDRVIGLGKRLEIDG
jgi:ribosomal protein S18 acetylase RimI-like enzyme